jgi:hypothetical protein
MTFLPNDTVQVKPDNADLTRAEQIAFVQDVTSLIDNRSVVVPVVENWSKDIKSVPMNRVDRENFAQEAEQLDAEAENLAAMEYEALYDTKLAGSAFAPFVVFRNADTATDFWDQKDNDIFNYIKSINMSLTELKYLEKFTSFGLKYMVNIKAPDDGVLDPNGILQLGVQNNSVPGDETARNFEVGEFKNHGNIDEVIKSIIFNLKMLYSMHHIPLDALISTNSVRSAESKEMDNAELFSMINAQRDIWNNNEQTLFGVLQAVYNRDNQDKIPKGVKMLVDFEENKAVAKEAEDWIVEVQHNVSTVLDWISSQNPDLDRDEVMSLLKANKAINEKQKEAKLRINQFIQTEEDINNNQEQDNDNNSDTDLPANS